MLKVPNMIVFPFMAVFRFFPVFTRLSSEVKNAQLLRGAKLSSRNPVTFTRRLLPLMYPIGRQFVRTNQIVTLSIVNRAFNANPMRVHKHLTMTMSDKIITVVAPIIFATLFYLVVTPPYYIGNI
jgi:energy-coupling factor transporter transmembrane protein EcfT